MNDKIRRGSLLAAVGVKQNESIPNNMIFYTSADQQIVEPYENDFGANLISNTYTDGKGQIVFDGDITYIGDNAFYECKSLTDIEIPNSVTSIGYSAFFYCSSLTSIEIPNSVTSIGDDAFGFCSSLTSIEIPNSVTSIEDYAFEGCSSLTSIVIPDSVTTIGDNAFSHCESLTNVVIGNSVTSIGYEAFLSCSSLTSVVIGNSVTSIGSWAFSDCSSLTSIEIPNSVTSIGSWAFYDCSSLTSIEIPNSVTSIGESAFNWCSSLTSVYIKSITPPTLYSCAFDDNASGRKIYVPIASLDDYKTASGWSEYADAIESYFTPQTCINLSILADNVSTGNQSTTTIHYTALCEGVDEYGVVSRMTLTGDEEVEIGQNKTTSTVQKTVSFTYLNKTATTTITQGPWVDSSYIVNLNNQWQLSSAVSNPNSSLYEGVYQSYANKGVNSSGASMYININGCTNFKFYIRSYAESNYDYVMVSQLDKTLTYSSSYSDTTLVKAHTRGKQQSGTALSNYTLVEFTNIPSGSHRIQIIYRKDSSSHSGDDRGYVLIPKNQ